MAQPPNYELLSLWVTASTADYSEPLTLLRWRDFILWSRIDLKKHQSLSTPDEWLDEYAEFDCAYEDWVEKYK